MKKIHNILFKCFMLLVLAVGWGGSVLAQGSNPVKSIEATFNNPNGNTNWASVTINPHALDASGVNVGGVHMSVTGSAALKVPQNAITNEFLGPNDQTSDGTACTYTFTIDGLPEGSKFDKIALPLKGVNSGGNNQAAGIKHVNVAIVVTDGANELYSTNLTDKSLTTQTVGEIHENISVTAPASFTTNTGSLVVKFTISKGTNNPGCFMAFHGLNLIAIDKLDDVDLRFVDRNGVPYTDDTKLVSYTPAGGGASVELGISDTHYSFGNVLFDRANFNGINGYAIENIVLTEPEGQQTLTFTVVKDPSIIQYSAAPTAEGWAAGTRWFTIQNNRSNQSGHNYKYLSTAESSVNDNYTLKASIAALENNRGEAWAFVEAGGGIQIYNAAYGPDFVLGSSSSGDNASANFKMVPKDDPGGYFTIFSAASNSVLHAPSTHSYAFRVGTSGDVHVHVTNGTLRTWSNGDAIVGSNNDGGSSFTLTAIEEADFDALPLCDVYKAQWRGASVSDFDINYNHSGNVFGRRSSVANGSYFIVNHDSPVALGDFTTTVSTEYALAGVNVKDDPAHAYRILEFFLKDAKATAEWTVNVNDGYTVTFAGDDYVDGGTFFLRPDVTPNALDFTINAVTDKFVWGPVFDTKNKTVTYNVRDLAADIPSGWYQLQVKGTAGEITTLASNIKEDEGNVNTKANTLYLAPAIYEPDNNRLFKVTGVPAYADEAATYIYIRNNGHGNLTFVHPSTGKEFTGTNFTFDAGCLTKSANWTYETSAHPLEGPYLLAGGSQSVSFNVAAVDMNDYEVYSINFTGSGVTSDVRLNINNPNVVGNKTVANGGYLFFKKGSNAPMRTQFSVGTGNVTIEHLAIGDKADGVTPLTLTLVPRQSLWTVRITGAAATTSDRVVYNTLSYSDGDMVGVPHGTTPTAIDFKTNVTDRFVWGPIINEASHTVTFEVRTAADDFTAGKWYQLQLSPTAEGRYYVPNETGNLVAGVLKMNPRHAGSQIYMIGGNKTSGNWTVEFIGKPENESETYLYVNSRSGNDTQVMMQNGCYITNESKSSSAVATTQFEYNSTTHEFHWRNPVYPWGNLSGMPAAVGKSSTADGPIKVIAHEVPVKAYKVVFTSGTGTLIYNGDTEIIGSNRAANGAFFFANDGAFLEGEDISNIDISKFDLRGIEGDITSITASTSNGITTLTVNTSTPSYNHEIIHKQNRYYDYLETDPEKPTDGFIQDGEGWSVRIGAGGKVIREQNTSVFEIPVYLKQDTSIESYLPTNQLNSYQRWYNWDTDGQVDETVLTNTRNARSKQIQNLSAYTKYNNGYVVFRGANNTDNDAYVPVLSLPYPMEEYNVGLDISRMTDYTQNVTGSNNSAIEPTLGMRIVYQVRDAKQIATKIKTASDGGNFFEVHDISLPNMQYGSRASRLQDRTLSTTLPFDMDLNNYWGFNGGGTGNGNLVQLTQDSQLRVELIDGGSNIQNYMMIPGSANANSGNISRTSFNTGHFVLFQYPDNGYIEPNSTAKINVYMTSGDREYKLVQFNLTFIGNAHPLVVTELKDSYRHPDALAEAFGAPVAELTFDQTPNTEYSTSEGGVTYPDYRYPIDYKGASYAFGARNGRNWAASRGEYALQSVAGSSKQTGTPRMVYYPVVNYLKSMKDPSVAFGSREEGAYELYIDAADQPGKIASIELKDALCAGSRLYCYGYIGCTSGGTDHHPTSVLINVMGIDKDTNKEKLVYSYCPGIITLRGYAEDGRTIYSTVMGNSSSYSQRSGNEDRNYWAPWQQIGFSFAISAEIASQMKGYTIQIMNNAYNSNGGDTMLDDFQIYVKKPGAEVQNTTPLCSDQIRHIKVITEYNTLIEATGEDINHDGLMNVGFCFLDKETYDKTLADNADNVPENGFPRNDPENKYNKAFGAALMGNRTLDKGNKDHAFHNFDIIRDGTVSNIYGETKQHFYTDIPQYSFKESGDDVVYRDSIRGERYIVFKESVAHGEPSSITAHKWTAGKSYYLLFTTAAISETHVTQHDLGCTVFNLDDNRCSVMYEFTVAPPVSIKGDVETITSGDEVQACSGQTPTITVNLNGRTETKDVVIKNLTYDWWLGYVSDSHMLMENGVPQVDGSGHAIFDGPQHTATYNTIPATMQNYMNVWWGTYPAPHVHLSKNIGDRIYLHDALLEFRRAYPNATDLVGVVPKHAIGDVEEYELTQEMIDCIAHFLQTEPESGYTPLVLGKKELSLTLGVEKADEDKVVHFVVIPIAPNIYSIDEDAIYCPDPQELKIKLLNDAPKLANGFNNMTYPEAMDNVPVRIGLQQINNVRHRGDATQRTLTIPIRKPYFAYPQGTSLIKSNDVTLYLVGTDDPAYKRTDNIVDEMESGIFNPSQDEIDEMFVDAGEVKILTVLRGAANPTMQVIFNNSIQFREGYTYTFKVKFYELEGDDRDPACEGSFVFDMKVVPEYQVWTNSTGNSDWTNDRNWSRADRAQLLAGNEATGNGMPGATALNDAVSYITNEANTTNSSFVPMYFTNVIFKQYGPDAVELYKDGSFRDPALGTRFLEGLQSTATNDIIYDMLVKPVSAADRTAYNYDCNYDCELFNTYVANGVTFEPGTQMGNAHYLNYNKAWVEYLLTADRWYTVGSPLKKSVAGDWYSPTAGGKQLTPHFYDINYSETLNDRFRPAYFQRSWDRDGNNVIYTKSGGTYDSYVRADWSNVYNDATVNYNAGGFSVKAELDYMDPADRPADGKVLVRLPKADTSYTYYDVAGSTGQAADAAIGARTESYRLLSDDLGTDGTGSIAMNVSNETADNNFLLLSNPFMAAMDMDKFFAANTDLEEKYWIVDADHQMVSLKSADSGEWITTSDAGGKYVAPLQGFFVKKKDAAPNPGSLNASYTAAMQTVVNPDPVNPGVSLRAPASRSAVADIDVIRLVAERNGAESTALIVLNENAHDAYVVGEDCETFLDGNLETKPNVYTAAAATAQSINVRKTLDMVPVGIISTDDSPAVLRFDLSDSSHAILYLYDSETDSYTTVNDGTEVTMPGNNAGRYFIVSDIRTILDDETTEVSEAVDLYNLHGIRVATSQRGTVTIRGSRKEFNR